MNPETKNSTQRPPADVTINLPYSGEILIMSRPKGRDIMAMAKWRGDKVDGMYQRIVALSKYADGRPLTMEDLEIMDNWDHQTLLQVFEQMMVINPTTGAQTPQALQS